MLDITYIQQYINLDIMGINRDNLSEYLDNNGEIIATIAYKIKPDYVFEEDEKREIYDKFVYSIFNLLKAPVISHRANYDTLLDMIYNIIQVTFPTYDGIEYIAFLLPLTRISKLIEKHLSQ